MTKILETRLPLATDDEISTLQFATGTVIFNSTVEVHQAFDGTEFRNLYEHQTYVTGLGGTLSVGSVTVTIS